MAEYWKSTPKYWCKHCSTYVKDTKFERNQHEATGRHQGNLKRFLRGIQNDHEKTERDKQRALSEVERLNRAVGGSSSTSQINAQVPRRAIQATTSQPSIADRKRQVAQLTEMGVAVPDEYRGEMALAGDWQVVSQQLVDTEDRINNEPSLSTGIRKRKFEGQEEEEDAGEMVKKKGWGSTIKQYPSIDKEDLSALLAGDIPAKNEDGPMRMKKEESDNKLSSSMVGHTTSVDSEILGTDDGPRIKQELSELSTLSRDVPALTADTIENMTGTSEVIFKKRRSKVSRQK